jgi:hypothetical protein
MALNWFEETFADLLVGRKSGGRRRAEPVANLAVGRASGRKVELEGVSIWWDLRAKGGFGSIVRAGVGSPSY